jgi:hypothetical protein
MSWVYSWSRAARMRGTHAVRWVSVRPILIGSFPPWAPVPVRSTVDRGPTPIGYGSAPG